jgi:hypothetical protein
MHVAERANRETDIADALALTFARPVFPRQFDDWMNTGENNVQSEYDIFEHDKLLSERSRRRPQPRYYAPS